VVVIESMKMEVAIRSDGDGKVEKILVSEGDSVKRGQVLARFQGQ
jgi:biotin carboxyl carrier protein